MDWFHVNRKGENKSHLIYTLDPLSLKMISTSRIFPNCWKRERKKKDGWMRTEDMSCILPQGVSTVQPRPPGSQPTLLVFSIQPSPPLHHSSQAVCAQMLQPKVYNSLKINNSSSLKHRTHGSFQIQICFPTPNICRRSGSRKRKGMLDTWRRLGVPLSSASTPAVPPPPPPPEPTPDWPSIWEEPSGCLQESCGVKMKENSS